MSGRWKMAGSEGLKKTTDMTVGKPFELIIKFAVPLFLGNVFQQFYNMADSAIVGQALGIKALTSVGASASILFLVFGFCIGTCAGFAVPVAQKFGARDYSAMRRYVFNSFYLSVAIAAIVTLATTFFCRDILLLIHTPQEFFDDAYRYLFIIFLGIPCTILYNEAASIMRSLGDSSTPFFYLVVAAISNIVFDLLLILVMKWGVIGAAVATVLAQLISGILSLRSLMREYDILRPEPGEWRFDSKICRTLLAMGVPMGLQCSTTAVGSIMLQVSVNGLAACYVSAYAAALKLKSLFLPVFDSLGVAMASYCGQNFGAEQYERIRSGVKNSVVLTAAFSLVTAVVTVLWGNYLVMLFVKAEETQVIAAAHKYIAVDGALSIAVGLLIVFRYCIQGIGRSDLAMVGGILEMIARTGMSLFVIPVFGWIAACYTDFAAWGSAVIYLVPVFIYLVHKQERSGTILEPCQG